MSIEPFCRNAEREESRSIQLSFPRRLPKTKTRPSPLRTRGCGQIENSRTPAPSRPTPRRFASGIFTFSLALSRRCTSSRRELSLINMHYPPLPPEPDKAPTLLYLARRPSISHLLKLGPVTFGFQVQGRSMTGRTGPPATGTHPRS